MELIYKLLDLPAGPRFFFLLWAQRVQQRSTHRKHGKRQRKTGSGAIKIATDHIIPENSFLSLKRSLFYLKRQKN
jgi:hypothetical protein